MLRRVLLPAVLLLAACTVRSGSDWSLFGSESDEERKSWSEIDVQPPAYPRDDKLLRFDAGAATAHRFYIDSESLSVGSDRVVRYVLVVKTGGGATNVSFEGIRCETREQKLYALGERGGRWVPARDPAWRHIEYQDLNRHHGVLYAEFFCPDRRRPAAVKDILEALRRESLRLR